jgi:hypothetical protein
MARPAFLAALIGAAAVSPAPSLAAPPPRESTVEVFGSDPCPRSTNDEIVVCSRRPEEERYRIPAPLRHGRHPPEQSGVARAETMDEVSRATMPDSCSVVGSYGQSGCQQALIRQWYAARRAPRVGP